MLRARMVAALIFLLAAASASAEFVVLAPPGNVEMFGIRGRWSCEVEIIQDLPHTICKKG